MTIISGRFHRHRFEYNDENGASALQQRKPQSRVKYIHILLEPDPNVVERNHEFQ